MAILPDQDIPPGTKLRLNHTELTNVKDIFVRLFDLSIGPSMYSETEKEALASLISKLASMFMLHTLPHPRSLTDLNTLIFESELSRTYVMELLEQLSIEVAAIGDDGFRRLINTLAGSYSDCKSISKERSDGLEPILTQIGLTPGQVIRTYLENPWLVVTTLLVSQYPRTKLAQTAARFPKQQQPS